MKFAAIAVTLMFAASPALAQGYGGADNSSNSSAAVPATPATPSANSSDDTRMASNQTKHHQHKKSSTSTQDQSNGAPPQANPGSAADSSATQPVPTPQQ